MAVEYKKNSILYVQIHLFKTSIDISKYFHKLVCDLKMSQCSCYISAFRNCCMKTDEKRVQLDGRAICFLFETLLGNHLENRRLWKQDRSCSPLLLLRHKHQVTSQDSTSSAIVPSCDGSTLRGSVFLLSHFAFKTRYMLNFTNNPL